MSPDKFPAHCGQPHPFQVSACGRRGDITVAVAFGQVRNITAMIGGVPLDQMPAPLMALSGRVVYLDIQLGAKRNVKRVTVESAAVLPFDRPNKLRVAIASIDVNAHGRIVVTQHLNRSLWFDRFAVSGRWFLPL